MSTIIQRVALPRPLPIENLLRFLSLTQGRDKLYRLIQYFCRFLAFYLAKMNPSAELVQRIQKLSVSVGLARKRKR
jgi:peroxin-11B